MTDVYSYAPAKVTRATPPFWFDCSSGTGLVDRRSARGTESYGGGLSVRWADSPKRHKVLVTIPAPSATRPTPGWSQGYLGLLDTMRRLAQCEDPEENVESGAILQACRVLAVLIEGVWAPPRIHWHGGDAIVLSWTRGTREVMLTVTDEGQSLLVMKGGIVEHRERVELEDLEAVVRPRIEQNLFYAYSRY